VWLRQASRETTVTYYTGIDVSLEVSHFCIVDTAGSIVKEARVASEPEAIITWFEGLGLEMTAIGLEAGPLSQWLYAAMIEAKLPVVLLETHQVRDAFRSMPAATPPSPNHSCRLFWSARVHADPAMARSSAMTRALAASARRRS
jgi:transposase